MARHSRDDAALRAGVTPDYLERLVELRILAADRDVSEPIVLHSE